MGSFFEREATSEPPVSEERSSCVSELATTWRSTVLHNCRVSSHVVPFGFEMARPTLNSSARHHLNRMAAPSMEPSMSVALAAYDYEYTHEQTFEITTKVVRSMPSTPMRE